jgi:SAM-dependent methyltransferase
MPAATRIGSERQFHDDQARQRALTFSQHPDKLRFSNETYLDHESWIRPAIQKLSDIDGLDVLDYGCGHGMAAVVFARMGARVTALELSSRYLAEARLRAEANAVHVKFIQADGEHLPFADETFDRIWGNAILHHLDVRCAGEELRRVLRPGGIAVLCEPWGGNPLLNWARVHLKYRAKQRTKDEQPLQEGDVRVLRALFPSVQAEAYQFLSMVRRIWTGGRSIGGLEKLDRFFLARLPRFQSYCRYVVLTLTR